MSVTWCVDNRLELHLLRPTLRYTDAPPGHSFAHSRLGWEGADGHSRWVFADGLTRMHARFDRARAGSATAGILSVGLEALQPVGLELCLFELASPSAQPPSVLDKQLRWRVLRGAANVGSFGPILIRWLDNQGRWHELRALEGSVTARVGWQASRIRLSIAMDAAALHPRWQHAPYRRSTAAPTRAPGWSVTVRLLLAECPSPQEQLWTVSPYPAGCEATITLTDHSDYDSTEALGVFLRGDREGEGWLGRGLRMTKGVFALDTSAQSRSRAPSLGDPSYGRLVAQLRADGSEVAPHGLVKSGSIDRAALWSGVGAVAKEWGSKTWIDHGYLRHCYTMGAADDTEYQLLDALLTHGYVALWSYHDVPSNAAVSLNLLSPPRTGVASAGRHAIARLLRAEPLVASHYLRLALDWRLPTQRIDSLKSIAGTVRRLGMMRALWRTLSPTRMRAPDPAGGGAADCRYRYPFTVDELIEMGAVLYPERAVPLYNACSTDLLLFVTAGCAHARDVYTVRALSRLVRERGIHIGHTYILSRLPYLAGVLKANGSSLCLQRTWLEFMDALSQAVSAGQVWNPTLADLATWARLIQSISAEPLGAATVRLSSRESQAVAGFTLLLPPDILPSCVRWSGSRPAGWRHWGDWLAVWGPVRQGGEEIVTWQS